MRALSGADYFFRFCLTALVLLPALAHAQCSRTIQVAVSATGQGVVISRTGIDGIYPELLRLLEQRSSCRFAISAVPRARLEAMFENGHTDLMIPATQTPRRDELGYFIPLIQSRPTLISMQSSRPAIKSVAEVLHQPNLRVVLVRGYDYGTAYLELKSELERSGRLTLEAEPLSVARMLNAGLADVTIMAPSILAGAMLDDAKLRSAVAQLRLEPLTELPWGYSGVYLSKASLRDEDLDALRALLTRAAKSDTVWKGFQKRYAPAILKDAMRPL